MSDKSWVQMKWKTIKDRLADKLPDKVERWGQIQKERRNRRENPVAMKALDEEII